MKQTKDTNSELLQEIANNFNPEYFRNYFDRLKHEGIDVEEQRKIQKLIIDKAADHYSKKLNMPEKTARAAVMDIVTLTSEPMDIEKTLEKLLFAVRVVSPKLHGLESRENDNLEVMRELKNAYRNYESRIAKLEDKLEFQQKVFMEAMQVVTSNPPNLWNVIKCSLNSLLSFLRLKKRS